MAAEKACPSCKLVTYDSTCPLCGAETSNNWSGMLVVIDPDESDIAKEMNITTPGRYALKVRKK